MRALLVYPRFPDTFWSFRHALRFVRKRASLPPLGLVTVASMFPKEWELQLVDMNVGPLKRRDLEWADCVFISAMMVQRESAEDVIARCQALGVRTVAGGPLFTSQPDAFPQVDHLILGEGEISIPPFLRDLQAGTPKRIYQADRFPSLAETPAPRWALLELKHYSDMCVQYSRGCPYDCEFCDITALFGHRPRTKSAEQIVAELDALYAEGWRGGVFFVDDNFIGNKRKLKAEVLPALAQWRADKQGFRFHTEVSINLADDDELMELMVQAGFDTVFVGIETPDEDALIECNKYQNQGRDLVDSVKTLQRAGLQVQGGFIVGFDSDTPTIFQRQIEFIQQSGIVTAMVGLLQALPGTKLHARMKSEGRLVSAGSGNNTDASTNFLPKMDIELLRQGYRNLVQHLYSPKVYYERVRTFLREYEKPHIVQHKLDWTQIRAFFRSILILGILGEERWEYWKLLAWTLARRPRLFADAVTLAIYGYHFRKLSLRLSA